MKAISTLGVRSPCLYRQEKLNQCTAGRAEKVAVFFFKNLEQLIKKVRTCNSRNVILSNKFHDNTLNVEVSGLIAIYEV